jgi:hypothetical protein
MSNESEYLQEVKQALHEHAEKLKQLHSYDQDAQKQLATLLKEALDVEAKLRKKHKLGARFLIIQQQLQKLYDDCMQYAEVDSEQAIETLEDIAQPIAEDEIIVYVHLLNAQGKTLASWQRMLTSRALREHSVNRPIYADKKHIDELFRSKPNLAIHGVIEAVVNKRDVLVPVEKSTLKDSLGNPLIRLKQGGLKTKNLRCFHYLGKKYHVSEEGDLRLM